MFDIGFSELVVIGVVALLVLGPERMPGVARTIGALMGRAQRYVNDVKSEIRREMHIEDMKKLESHLNQELLSAEESVRGQLRSAEEVARGVVGEVHDAVHAPEAANLMVASAEENSLLAAPEMPHIEEAAEPAAAPATEPRSPPEPDAPAKPPAAS